MSTWITIFGMALVTLLSRALPLFVLRGKPPPWLRVWLGAVPVAVFTALAVRPLLVSAGPPHALMIGPPLVAGLVGAAVAWRSGSVVATIAAGMATYWLLRLLGL
jgi:branched-subunit amino acid transport protein